MTAIEQQLQETLERFLQAASRREDLAALLQRISDLQAQLEPSGDSRLQHYLERRSYQKALEHLVSKSQR
jgi:hypothetical protein